ncbi:MAG: DUF4358 domain-containing protein [Oscillospiraceae bacterium]|nr:DUF4358 domain-containing protein [Oscillospiraceae bacterium]
MNQIFKILVLMVIISLLFSACGNNLKTDTSYSVNQISEAIISAQTNISPLKPLFPDNDYFNEYLSNIYQINADVIKDGAIYYADGMLADEIAVLLLKDNSNIKDIEDALTKYKEKRMSAFLGYAPKQAAILEKSIVTVQGNYACLIICDDPQKAESVFKACFSNNLPEIREDIALLFDSTATTQLPDNTVSSTTTQLPDNTESSTTTQLPDNTESSNTTQLPDNTESSITTQLPDSTESTTTTQLPDNQEDVYDSAAILKAWQSGNKAGLSSKNLSILDACSEIINEVISKDMSDYEKELAIHDWIIDHIDYDDEANNHSPDAKPDPDNDNPYGAIIHKKAICSGYSSTFQLFMDLLGIQCITVHGSTTTGDEHAWNMVQIDGNWYCVDVTWDNPAGIDLTASVKHKYFNVTSQFMRETQHVWDESNTPIADSGKLYK